MHVLYMLLRFDARAVERLAYDIIYTPALNRTTHSLWAAYLNFRRGKHFK